MKVEKDVVVTYFVTDDLGTEWEVPEEVYLAIKQKETPVMSPLPKGPDNWIIKEYPKKPQQFPNPLQEPVWGTGSPIDDYRPFPNQVMSEAPGAE